MNGGTGEVKEVYRDGGTARFEWRIPDFCQLWGRYQYSPTMTFFKMDWYLGIRKIKNSINNVYLLRDLLTPGNPESVRVTITCKTSGREERHVAREQTLPGDRREWNLDIDPPCRTLSSAGVTLTCTLWKGDSPLAPGVSRETQTEDTGFEGVSRGTQTEDARGRNDEHPLEDTSSLSVYFKKLLLSGTGHDVLIKVGDKQFSAHKHILEVRSPVFAAMFGNEMAESADGFVTIEDCDRDSFGEFLQFVYSGKADVASVGRALGLYYAGDKYDFPRLKEMCVEFLKISFTTTTVFDVVTLAARHNEEELLQQAIVYLSAHLEEVMCTVEWQRFLLANPIQANEMCLKALKCRNR